MPVSPPTHTRKLTTSTHKTAKHEPRQPNWGQGRGGSKWRTKRKRVFERDGYTCQLCSRAVTLHGKHHGVCDHIVALSRGGADDDSNLQCICQACDKEKTQKESQS